MTSDDSRRRGDRPPPPHIPPDGDIDVLFGELEEAAEQAANAPLSIPAAGRREVADDEQTSSHRLAKPREGDGEISLDDVEDDDGVGDLLDEVTGELGTDRRGGTVPPPAPAPRAPSVPPPLPGPGAPLSSHAPRPERPEGFEREALELVHACEEELARTDDPRRAARLHYEVARVAEGTLGDLRRAAAHYLAALERAPDHLPTIRGARRVLVARRQVQQALPLFDAEARVTPDPRRKAALFHRKGRLLEDVLKQRDAARQAYATALELDRSDPALLKALEQVETEAGQWDELAKTLEREANAVAGDARHRAAIVVERARLVETRRGDVEAAIELYETALRLDPRVHDAIEALKRLHFQQRRWQDLIRVLHLEAERSADASVRASAFYRIGRLHAERLGNRDEAVAALERAAADSPDDPLVLGELARLYEAAERWAELAGVLERLVRSVTAHDERLALLHRIGLLAEDHLGDEEGAVAWYEQALRLDPTHVPTLQALSKLHERAGDWEALVAMVLREAEASDDVQRRAAAHARVAELLETRLGRSDEAVEQHARALALAPTYEPSFKALARLLAEKGRWRELVQLHERAVDVAGDRERAITHLFKVGAVLEDALGDPAQAAHAYRRVLELDASHLGAIHALQRTTERAGRPRELVAALELEAEKTRDEAHLVALLHRAGEVLDDVLGDRDAAIERFRRALAVDPKHLPSLTSLGRIFHRAGRWDDLLEMYERELEITPHGPRAVALLQKMGELCAERVGRDEEALRHWRRAVEIDPDYGPALRSLARRLRERGDWHGLVRVLELELEGLEEPGARARAAVRLAEVYEERLGQVDQAIAAYESAVRAEPGYRPAIEALGRLRTEQRAWSALVEELDREASTARDEALWVSALVRQGETWAEELNEPRRAIACFEKVRERAPAHLGALLQLERLYRRTGHWEALAGVYEAQARVLRDPGARIAALRELARLADQRGVGAPAQPRLAHLEILAIDPEDRHALEELERIALGDGDRDLLVEVDRRLATLATDPLVAASHRTRLAESLEARDEIDGAIRAYRGALEGDPTSLAATRGLSRLAARTDDPEMLADAARREAKVAGDRAAAARLLVRSATVRAERLGDPAGAAVDLERALELAPDHPEAAARLVGLLEARSEHARLADLLARAAGSATQQERSAALWMEVARLQADHLDNLAAAISALHRVLRTAPDHVEVLRRLAGYFGRDGQWTEAVNLLGRVVQLAPEREVLRDVHVELATIWSDALGETARALVSLQAVLALDPSHREALERISRLHEREGRLGAAAEAAAKLVSVAQTPEARAAALLRLAEVELHRGHEGGAAKALVDAVAIEGPAGEAALELKRIAKDAETWSRYAEAVERYRVGLPIGAEANVPTWLELARVRFDRLGQQDEAIAALRAALEATGQSPAVRAELARRLRMAGAHAEAAVELRELAQWDPGRADVWRDLALTWEALGAPYEARLAREPLVMLGEAREAEVEAVRAVPPRFIRARPEALAGALAALAPRQDAVATELLGALGEAAHKVFPVDLEPWGLTTRDRITPRQQHPLRNLAEQVVGVLGGGEFELYVHRVRSRGIGVELSHPPSLLVPAPVAELPEPQQVFLLARPLVYLARGLAPALKVMPRELEVLLAAAARGADASFGAGLTADDFLEEHARRIQRALPRRSRRAVEEVAARYVVAPRVDFQAFVQNAERLAVRVAAVLADDLGGCVEVLRRTEQELQGLVGAALLRRSGAANDLVRFWVSDRALELRRRLGYVG